MAKLTFLISLITEESDYQREQAASAQLAAARLNVDLRISYADNDAIRQSQQLFQVIHGPSDGVKAIIVEPAGSTAFPQVARAAVDAGLGWVLMNRDDASVGELARRAGPPVFSVTADQRETGRILGRQIGTLLREGGQVLCLLGPSSNPVSTERMAGMSETQPSNVKLKLLRCPYWTENAGFQAISSWLRVSVSQQVDFAAVIGQSDLIALGARRAFQELAAPAARQDWLALPFLGVNGLKVGQDAVQTGMLASTVIVPPSTVPAIELLVRVYTEGFRPPNSTLVKPKSYPDLEMLTPRAPKT
ncbi:MAG TPA: sugar ABC transporter substrate-binding protein [Candidatus Cybelea sp.]|nr:sugar ABC transporter substrate-binding protein [Candidatus Cybelea sp.]